MSFIVRCGGVRLVDPLTLDEAASAVGLSRPRMNNLIIEGKYLGIRWKNIFVFVDRNLSTGVTGGVTGKTLTVEKDGLKIVDPMSSSMIADLIGKHPSRVRQLIIDGTIRSIKHKQWVLIDPASALAYKPAPVGSSGHKRLAQKRQEWIEERKKKGLPT